MHVLIKCHLTYNPLHIFLLAAENSNRQSLKN